MRTRAFPLSSKDLLKEIPIVDGVLEAHATELGGDFTAYRNHAYRVANLCLPLVESIALAHDCGHGPAGHASEQAFSTYLPGTGYDHAVYGADVTLASLNLCLETLDGVRNHSWRRPAPVTPEEFWRGARSKLPTHTPTVRSRVKPTVQLSW